MKRRENQYYSEHNTKQWFIEAHPVEYQDSALPQEGVATTEFYKQLYHVTSGSIPHNKLCPG